MQVIAMYTRMQTVWRTLVCAILIAVPGSLIAAGDFTGDWHPYSGPVVWLGVMTVEPERLQFDTGPSAQLEPVRENGSVFRIVGSEGNPYGECGSGAQEYVAFRVLDNGLLARLYYKVDIPPGDPTGTNAMEIVQNGACSVMFYSR